MIFKKIHILFIALLIGLLPISPFCQSENEVIQNFDRSSWEKTIEGIDYSGEMGRSKSKKTDRKRRRGEASPQVDQSTPNRINFTGAGFLGKVLLFVVGAVVLYFLIRALMGLENPRNTKIAKEAEELAKAIEEAEENIPEADTKSLLQKAIEQEAYNLAVRLYFLDVLKELTLKGFINWKKNKTNRDYQRELAGGELQKDFKYLVLIFDSVWYGNHEIDKTAFQEIEPYFQNFIQAIQQQPKLVKN